MSSSSSNTLFSSRHASAANAGGRGPEASPSRRDVGRDRLAAADRLGEPGWDCLGAATTEAGFLANASLMAQRLSSFDHGIAMVGAGWYAAQATTPGCWPLAPLELDAHGRPQPAVDRFPSAMEGCGFAPLAAQVHRLGLRFGVHLTRGVPCQAVGQGLPIAGSPWRCDEIANPGSAWNTDMCGVDPDHPGAFDWYRAWFAQLAACGVDAITVDDVASQDGQAGEAALIRRAINAIGRRLELTLLPGSTLPRQRAHL